MGAWLGEIGFVPALAALLVVWAVALRESWRVWQPARWLLAGRYEDAQAAAERLQRSWVGAFASVRRSARYTVGCALHLMGDLEGSRRALASLHEERISGNLRYALCSIDAANLVMLGREHARACALLEEAAAIHRLPEDMLLAAHARLGLGEERTAARLFDDAGGARSGGRTRFGAVTLLEDRRQRETIFHALRGLYLVKVGRPAEAQRDLRIAAESPITNVYVTSAREHIAREPVDPGDLRSSLAPQIVANRGAADG